MRMDSDGSGSGSGSGGWKVQTMRMDSDGTDSDGRWQTMTKARVVLGVDRRCSHRMQTVCWLWLAVGNGGPGALHLDWTGTGRWTALGT